jgi:ssDNA-binding Zn-finger/Zn-ribbon topoisomerase 1
MLRPRSHHHIAQGRGQPGLLPGPASPLWRPSHRSVPPRRPRWLSALGAGSPRHSGLASATTVMAVRVGDACPACRRGLVQVRYRRNPTRTPFLGCSAFPDCRAVWQIDGTQFPGWDRPGCPPGRHRPAPPAGSSRSLCWLSWPLSWPPGSWPNCSGNQAQSRVSEADPALACSYLVSRRVGYRSELRVALVVVAVAHRRLGPSSSATTSTTERALPSSVVQARCWSRPTTTTRLPFDSD